MNEHKQPSITILIPTRGGGDLLYVLQTIAAQELIPEDEIIVIGDGPLLAIEEQINALGPPFRYAYTEKPTGDFGHSQLNYGLELATGDYIMGTDDDDGYLPRAIEVVRTALIENPGKLHLFKFWSNDRFLHWNENIGKVIKESLIGGHNLVLPNTNGKKGTFTSRYAGDFDWIRSVLSCYPERDWIWRNEILTRQRPSPKLLAWPVWKQSDYSPDRLEALRQIRNQCRLDFTHSRDEISPEAQAAWFNSLDRKNNWAWLFTRKDTPNQEEDYIGFVYLRFHDGTMTPTYGIAEAHRGLGYARHIVQFALDACMGDADGDLWESNHAIAHVDFALGWKEVSRKDGIITVHYPYPK